MPTIEELSRRANALRAELRKVEEESHRIMSDAQPLTAREAAQMADFQSRCDSVYREFGEHKHSPAPFAHERMGSFRRRVLNDLRQYSNDLKNVDFADPALKDDAVTIFETQVFNDAMKCAKSGDYLPKDVLTPRSHLDPVDGHRITEFVGPSFMRQFKLPQRIMRLRTRAEIHADEYR